MHLMRAATPGDLWRLRRKPRNWGLLFNEAMLARPYRPWPYLLRDVVEGPGQHGGSYIYRDGRSQALVQLRGRKGRPEQELIYFAIYGEPRQGTPTDYDIWHRLVEHACTAAGHYGVQRVYAPLSQRHNDLRELLKQLGFAPYTRQALLRLAGPDMSQGTSVAPMRVQTRQSVWGIHKLYGALTPRPVQQAEALSPRDWALPMARRWPRPSLRGWVLGDNDELVACLRLQSGPTGHVFRLLLRHEARDIAPDVIRFGLSQINDPRPAYVLLREYQSELLAPLEELGFQGLGEQTLLVKTLAAAVRRPVLLPVIEPGLEPNLTIPSISRTEGGYEPLWQNHET
jgi:hypothetical protein